LPVLVSLITISLVPTGSVTLLIPALALVICVYFLPFGFGNAYVRKVVRRESRAQDGFIVQLRLLPSLRNGLRAIAEDADDLGVVTVNSKGITFEGDSICFHTPAAAVKTLRLESSGWRGLFLYGQKVVVEVEGMARARKFELAERSSLTLPASWRNSRELYSAMNIIREQKTEAGKET
jgi:hypothetical protein